MTQFERSKPNKPINKEVEAERGSSTENLSSELEARLNSELKKEAGEQTIPEIKIHIFYGTHYSGQEAEILRYSFKEADVYIPELAIWNPGIRYALKDVIMGRKTPETVMKEQGISPETVPIFGFIKRELEILHNSKKPIAVVDVPYRNNISHKFSEQQGSTSVNKEIPKPTLGKLVQNMREKLRKYADAHLEREDFMIVQLERESEDVLLEYPELRKKGKINVLMFLGAAHTRVYHSLKKGGINVSREFGKMPQLFDHTAEAIRRFMFSKEVNLELGARTIMEEYLNGLLFSYLTTLTEDTDKIQYFLRKIVERFSVEEIKIIVESDTPGAQLTSALRRKKIYQPMSEAGLDAFISEAKK